MKTAQVTVKWEQGMHMRAAARLVMVARCFQSQILVRMGARVADARSIMSIMLLCASLGATFEVEASGEDEHEAITAVRAYFDGGNDNSDAAPPR